MLPINLEVIRLTLHVLGATIWVGGKHAQIPPPPGDDRPMSDPFDPQFAPDVAGALASQAANIGTALHGFIEQINLGVEPWSVPAESLLYGVRPNSDMVITVTRL